MDNVYIRLAIGENIQLLPNGLYNIDGNYYLTGKNFILRKNKELLVKIDDTVKYIIHW